MTIALTVGPDVPAILCYTPDNCCAPSPCAITEDQFICQIRSLLPEGDLYNTSLAAVTPIPQQPNYGATTIGCAKVGQEQLVFGGCCPDDVICDLVPVAPQLAVVDSFSAAAYKALVALCEMLKELDPCTAKLTLRRWAERMGVEYPDPCGGEWSDEILSILLCLMTQLRLHVMNWDFLTLLAARFGASIVLRDAGDFNCGSTPGWWTMKRTQAKCPPRIACPPDDAVSYEATPELVRFVSTCWSLPPSYNLIVCPTEISIPENCNLGQAAVTLPHNDELYEAFKWLLPYLLPRAVFWCIYECDETNCIW